jgi:branched-subunit amino acid aminotransferase/4-amino-4-deoxychorismate lyase
VRIPIDDAGFVWGATVTDRLRTFDGQLFHVADHLARFRESCRRAKVDVIESDEQIIEISNRLVTANHHRGELTLIWLATPGVSSGFAANSNGRIPTFIAYTQKLVTLRAKALARNGACLRTCPINVVIDPLIKHRSRLAWWIAAQQVHEIDADAEPLFVVGTSGHVLETSTANIVAVIDGVVTSPPSGSILNGVSLGVVRNLCQNLGLPFAERPLTKDDLHAASEVILTNTSFCVAGVAKIDDQSIPFPGAILNQLLDAWSNLVGVNVRPGRGS